MMNMENQGQITYKKIWEFLRLLAPYLTTEELNTLDKLFELMATDYTPVRSFGDASVKYILVKEETPYISNLEESFNAPRDVNIETKTMFDSFNRAKEHMEVKELQCIQNLLNMINQYQMTIRLIEEEGDYYLTLARREPKEKEMV